MPILQQIGAGLALVGAALSISGCTQTSTNPSPVSAGTADSLEERRHEIQITVDGLRFDAIIDTPSRLDRNRWGVLLIGGGMGNDLNWTVPGFLQIGDSPVQVTVSGSTHEDAPAISRALVDRGFAVMRWSTIAEGDEFADQWPVRATPRTQRDLMHQAKGALALLRQSGLIEPDRVILLGHSLGSARACTIAATDDCARALILLAPAYFSRETVRSGRFESEGMRFGEEVLADRCIPCLALFGALDTSSVVGSCRALRFSLESRCPEFDARVFEGLGHQLGVQKGSLVGPIAELVLDQMSEWADEITRRPRSIQTSQSTGFSGRK